MRFLLRPLLPVVLTVAFGCTSSKRSLPAGVPSVQSSHARVVVRNTLAADLDVYYSVNGRVEAFAGRVNGMTEGEVRITQPCGCLLFGLTAGDRVSLDFVRGKDYSYLVPRDRPALHVSLR